MESLVIHVFDVGQGDNLLLEFPDNQWGLIDCCLKTGQIESPALTYLKGSGIRQLEFLCLTHPHSDHFNGMLEVLEYFTSGDRSLRQYWDFGMDPIKLEYLKWRLDEAEFNSLYKLYDKLYEKFENQEVEYIQANKGVLCFASNNVRINSYSPSGFTTWKVFEKAIKNRNFDRNLLCVVLVISLGDINAILTSDSHCLDNILSTWKNDRLKFRKDNKFKFVKVSHHGSEHGNSDELWKKYTRRKDTLAVISTGCEYDTPDISVVKSILSNKLRLYSTNYRDFSAAKVPNKSTPLPADVSEYMQEALEYLTEAVDEFPVLKPFHGDCHFTISMDGGDSVNTSINRPAINKI